MKPASQNQRPFRISLRRRLSRRFGGLGPMLVWSVALIAALTLYVRQERGLTVTGFVVAADYQVSPEVAGRLRSLEVSLLQEVARGQILARMDDEGLILKLQESRIELERLRSELDREEMLRATDQETNLRRFMIDVENAHIDYLDGLASLAEERISLQNLESILERSRRLNRSELIPLATMEQDSLAYSAQLERVIGLESLVEGMRDHYQDASQRYETFEGECVSDCPEDAPLIKPLAYAAEVQEIRIAEVNLAIARLVLRSPVDGQVVEICHRPGEVITEGDPVVSIVDSSTTEVVAYLHEEKIQSIAQGQEVKVKREAEPRWVHHSIVTSVGANIQQLPPRLDPTSRVPGWGFAVTIPLPDGLNVRPGEALTVTF